jgi:hypothetical protein
MNITKRKLHYLLLKERRVEISGNFHRGNALKYSCPEPLPQCRQFKGNALYAIAQGIAL